MKKDFKTIEEYVDNVREEHKNIFLILHRIIKNNIPKEFKEEINYNMIGYVVPLDLYPNGYKDPKIPLPFINLGDQKNYVSLYHLAIYANEDVLAWFLEEYEKKIGKKPNMGKSCIRFKKEEEIPVELLEELMKKISINSWINTYEKSL